MTSHPITDRVYAFHADVGTGDRFEGMWPLPTGVTLNSYLVKGEKTGQTLLLSTTKKFSEYFGISTKKEDIKEWMEACAKKQ